jgi:hypothetical protein
MEINFCKLLFTESNNVQSERGLNKYIYYKTRRTKIKKIYKQTHFQEARRKEMKKKTNGAIYNYRQE